MSAAHTFDKQAIDKALSKAKIGLMSAPDSVFFSTVCMSMRHRWDETIPTACTDGRNVWYSPRFFMEHCQADERVGLVLHETLHPAFHHMVRRGDRDPKRWNKAADYAINLIIVDAGFKLPKGALLDKRFRGMTVEQIYDILTEAGDEGIEPDWDDLREPTPEEAKELADHIDDVLVQATLQSKVAGDKPGSIPAEIERYVDNLLNPSVPWYRVLRSFMTKLARNDYSYRKLNRRFLPEHIMPSLYSEAVCDIAVAVDASGSVTDEQFSHFVNETTAILKLLKPEKIHFLQFTTRLVGEPQVIKSLADIKKLAFAGKGGTKIDPVMAWARDHKPTVLLVFSDGHYRTPSINPRVPVIWLINDNPGFSAPFGKHIRYEFKA